MREDDDDFDEDFDLDKVSEPESDPQGRDVADAEANAKPWALAGTSFCPECGTENAAGTEACGRCGRILDPLATAAQPTPQTRQLNGAVVATVAGICMAAVVIAWLGDWSLQLRMEQVLRLEGKRPVLTPVLTSSAGLAQVFGIAAAFGVAGLVAALVFAARYLREVVLGAVAGVAVQLGLWLFMARSTGGTMRGDLWIVGDGFVMRGPAPLLITQLLLVMLFTAMLFAFAGWIAREQLTGHATCVYCHTPYALHPTPPVRCPKCDTEQDRDGVQWPWVMLVALITAIVFGLVLALLRERLGFALECHGRGRDLSEVCRAAQRNEDYSIFVTSMRSEQRVFWAIDQWRYLEITGVLMLIAPLVLTFVVKRGSRASAGVLVPINWMAASFVVMIVLADLGGSEAGFIFLMRMQVLALFGWGVLGVIGVLVGDKLRFRKGSAYLDELDE